jgi:hypothetical protein
MSIFERITAVITLTTTGIWAGIILLYSVERINLWARMPTDQFIVDFRRSVYRADPLQPILALTSFLGAVVLASITNGDRSQIAWLGAILIGFVIVISLAWAERINSQFRRRPEGEAPPDPDALRKRWRKLHILRTPPAILAVIAISLAATAG